MIKTYELVVKVIGDGSEAKKKELIAKVVQRIKVEGECSLGSLQASLTIAEK